MPPAKDEELGVCNLISIVQFQYVADLEYRTNVIEQSYPYEYIIALSMFQWFSHEKNL